MKRIIVYLKVGLFLFTSPSLGLGGAYASRSSTRITGSVPATAAQRSLPLGSPSISKESAALKLTSSPSALTNDDSSNKKKTILERIEYFIPPADERKKFLPLGLMFFCILFNYTILRGTKDVLMITAPKSGAEVIPFIKTYVILPVAIAFTTLYVKLTDWIELKNIFYVLVIPFLAFFAFFGAVIYPNEALLHPHVFTDLLASHLPAGFAAPLSIIRNWSFSLFYLMAEMWGTVVATLLFWGFANEVSTVAEAKKYYPLFGLGANVALIISGQYMKWVSLRQAELAPGVDPWAVALKYLMSAVVVSGAVMIGAYKHMQDNILGKAENLPTKPRTLPLVKKPKLSLKESLKFLMDSPYIRDLALLVISSSLCLNIVEVSWKAKLKEMFPDPSSYSAFMGNFSSATGAVTLVMMILGRYILQRFGWRTAALFTPTMIGMTGLAFFALTIFPGTVAPLASAFGTSPLMIAVLVGAAQNILSKSSKYSLFDPCKEMAYIPLDQDSRTKGKAAIDVVGTPLGKSGSSILQQFLIFWCGSLAASTPYLAVILGIVIYLWFQASESLAKQFDVEMAKNGLKE